MKASGSKSSGAPSNLHDVVLDYIAFHAYSSTAKILAKSRSSQSAAAAPSLAAGPSAFNGISNGSNGATSIPPSLATTNGKSTPAVVDGEGDEMDIDMDLESRPRSGLRSNGAAFSASGPVVTSTGPRRLLSPAYMESLDRRRDIINHILNGAILRAIDALNAHFPAVLAPSSTSSGSHANGSSSKPSNGLSTSPSRPSSMAATAAPATSAWTTPRKSSSSGIAEEESDMPGPPHSLPVFRHSTNPAHVALNLQIQNFIEHFRAIAPSSPGSPSSSIGSMSMSMSITLANPAVATSSDQTNGAGPSGISNGAQKSLSASTQTLQHTLAAAQGLHLEAKKLKPEDRAVYLAEIKDAGALFAYNDPETSPLQGFLEQGRRIALAEQVNRAILHSEGESTQPLLDTYARRTTLLFALLAENGVDSVPPWTAIDGHAKEQLALYLKSQSKSRFKLADYAAQALG